MFGPLPQMPVCVTKTVLVLVAGYVALVDEQHSTSTYLGNHRFQPQSRPMQDLEQTVLPVTQHNSFKTECM